MDVAKTKKYNRIKLILSISGIMIDLGFWLAVIFVGISTLIANWAVQKVDFPLFQFYIFAGLLGLMSMILTFPLTFYSGYLVEHRFNLSNQNLWQWIREKVKGLLVSLPIGGLLITGIYLLLWKSPHWWWLWAWIFLVGFTLILGRIAPILIFPIFYKFKPLENQNLQNRIQNLAEKWGLTVSGVYQFNLSKNTKKANAAFTGIGKSRRVILGDTLLENFAEEEIETIFAHEIGHHVHRHLLKGILFNSILSLAGLVLTFQLYQVILDLHHYQAHQLGALPYLALLLFCFGLITGPLGNLLSRHFEYQADQFAVDSTGKASHFSNSLKKLGQLNLADDSPHPVIEFLFYSHPSINHRINKISGVHP